MPQPQGERPPAKKPEIPNYVYIDTAAELHAAVHQLRQRPTFQVRTVDTETTGCEPFVHRLKVVQIGVAGLPIYVIQIERVPTRFWEPLRQYLAEARPSVLQNAKFDLKMLAAEGLTLAGLIKDTIIRSRLYHLGNRLIDHSLKALAFEWCNLDLDKAQRTSFVADESREPLSQEQRDYAAIDISATTQLETDLAVGIQEHRGKRPGILAHVEREERFLPLLAKLENQGVQVDTEAVNALVAAIKDRLEALEAQLLPALQPELQQIKLDLGFKPAFQPTKLPKEQVITVLGLEDNDAKTLLQSRHPLARLISEHNGLWRQLNCCYELLQKRNHLTGRWHPDYTQIDNLQGSLGPSKLKVELLERLTKSWRPEPLRLLRPDDGYELLEVSFPGLELTLLAHYSQDPVLLLELASDQSPVAYLAHAIATASLSVDGQQDSFVAQVLWHGHGILNQKHSYLQEWLWQEHGLILKTQQVKNLQKLIPERYPVLAEFQSKVGNSNYETWTTSLGALRLWSKTSPKDVRNFLIWSSFSELLKECVCWLQPCCSATKSSVTFIGEQSLLLEVPQEQTEVLTETVLETLTKQLSQHCPQLAITIAVTPTEN